LKKIFEKVFWKKFFEFFLGPENFFPPLGKLCSPKHRNPSPEGFYETTLEMR